MRLSHSLNSFDHLGKCPKELLNQVKTNEPVNTNATGPFRRHRQLGQPNSLWHYSFLSTLMALETGKTTVQSTGPKKLCGPSSCWHKYPVTECRNVTVALWCPFFSQQLLQQICCDFLWMTTTPHTHANLCLFQNFPTCCFHCPWIKRISGLKIVQRQENKQKRLRKA